MKKIDIVVAPPPQVEFDMKTGQICLAEKIFLRATGAEHYIWEPAASIKYEGSEGYIRVMDSTLITVIGIDGLGCRDTNSIKYTQIEDCCRFWYPNAFTPNNDGKNDVFKPVIYGETEHYDLYIYNRFGEVVFHTANPTLGWDGKYKGQLCDVGMYYYMVKARCYTGMDEFESNAVDLLR
jgi:gliding motility-associated-like protein